MIAPNRYTTKPISNRVCELCNPRDSRAMRALESLTPNGSEFVNDPERCVEFVRDRLAFLVQIAKERNMAQQEARELRAAIKALAEELRKAKEDSYDGCWAGAML